MARLPRYRPLGIGVTSLPGVNFAATGQAEARVAQTIANSLDRMSSFAFREAETQAKIEGAEYGAGNAPTAQQLMDAQTPADLEALVPGGTGTVRDRAARAAALDAISTNLETSAREQITALRLSAAETNMPTMELQSEIDAVINGYAGTLFDISPTSARQFRASVAAIGNTAVVTHANKMAAAAEAERKIQAIRGIDTTILGVAEIVERGDIISPDTGLLVSRMSDVLAGERNAIFKIAGDALDPTLLNQKLESFDKAVDDAIIGTVRDYVVDDPLIRQVEVMSGKIADKRIAGIYSQMNPEQRRAAIDASFEVASRDLSHEAALERKAESMRKSASIGLRGDIAMEMNYPGSTGSTLDELLDRLKDVDAEAHLVMQDRVLSSPAANDANTVIALNKIEAMGQMTHQVLLNALDAGNITFAEYSNRFDRLERLNDADFSTAVTYIKNAINPVPNIFGGGDDEANKQIGEITNELILAQRKDPGLDPVAWAQNRLKDLQPAGPTAKQIADAQAIVSAYARQNGVGDDIASVDAAIQEEISSGNRAEGIRRTQPIMNALDILKRAQQQ